MTFRPLVPDDWIWRQCYASLLEILNIINDFATLKTLSRTITIIPPKIYERAATVDEITTSRDSCDAY